MPTFDPAVFDPLIFDAGPDFTNPQSPGTGPVGIEYDGVDLYGVEWGISGEEVLGGVARATAVFQDRRLDSTWEPEAHKDIRVFIRATDWTLFRGETLTPQGSVVVGTKGPPWDDFRRWTVPCRDYNGLISETLFGAPDGSEFWQPNVKEPFRPIDPSAINNASDKTTIQNWIAHYRPIAGFVSVETAAHVHEYATNLGDPIYAIVDYDAMSNLGAAIAKLAALLPVNVQDWLDMDGFWRHVAIPDAVTLLADGDEGDLEAAPSAIGPGGKGHMGIQWGWDGSTMPEQLYAQGQTTFSHDGVNPDSAGANGFYPVDPDNPNVAVAQDPTKRQAYLPIPGSWTRARSIAVTAAALRRAASPTLRMSVTIEGVDGWRAGQVVSINEARFPPSLQGSHKFVVQRVAWDLYAGNDVRKYTLDVGDGAVSRANQGGQRPSADAQAAPKPKQPAISWQIQPVDAEGHPDNSPIGANETRDMIVNTANALGEQQLPVGTSVTLGVVARDGNPDSGTYGDIVPDMGTFDPNPATTDADGHARSTFTAGAQPKLDYFPFAETELPQA